MTLTAARAQELDASAGLTAQEAIEACSSVIRFISAQELKNRISSQRPIGGFQSVASHLDGLRPATQHPPGRSLSSQISQIQKALISPYRETSVDRLLWAKRVWNLERLTAPLIQRRLFSKFAEQTFSQNSGLKNLIELLNEPTAVDMFIEWYWNTFESIASNANSIHRIQALRQDILHFGNTTFHEESQHKLAELSSANKEIALAHFHGQYPAALALDRDQVARAIAANLERSLKIVFVKYLPFSWSHHVPQFPLVAKSQMAQVAAVAPLAKDLFAADAVEMEDGETWPHHSVGFKVELRPKYANHSTSDELHQSHFELQLIEQSVLLNLAYVILRPSKSMPQFAEPLIFTVGDFKSLLVSLMTAEILAAPIDSNQIFKKNSHPSYWNENTVLPLEYFLNLWNSSPRLRNFAPYGFELQIPYAVPSSQYRTINPRVTGFQSLEAQNGRLLLPMER